MTKSPVRRVVCDLEDEAFTSTGRPGVRWKTIFSADRTPTERLTCGVATIAPGQPLALHRHSQPEVYFGLEGRGRVLVAGKEYSMAPGVALFIPGGAEHGIVAEDQPVRIFYAFAADSFLDIEYVFLDKV